MAHLLQEGKRTVVLGFVSHISDWCPATQGIVIGGWEELSKLSRDSFGLRTLSDGL